MIIPPNNLTFCYQGPLESWTATCIKNTRQFFPDSRFVIGTNTPNDFLWECVKLVDAVMISDVPHNKDNIWRHMATSWNAITSANTDFVCKIRTDCELQSNNLLNIVATLQNDDIAVGNWHSYYKRLPFFYSDFVYCGLKERVKQLFHPREWQMGNGDHIVSWLPDQGFGGLCGRGCRPEQYIASRLSVPVCGNYRHPDAHLSAEEFAQISQTPTYQSFKVFSSSRDWNLKCHKYPNLAGLEPHFDV